MIRWTELDMRRDEADRERVCAWLRANGFDPARVPWNAWVAYDEDTDEFIVDYYERPWRIVDDQAARIRVRRRALASLEFPSGKAS